jgi:predicted Zn-dependent protease
MVGDMVNLRFSRTDELEADTYGVRALGESGYDPGALAAVMEVLASASGGSSQPEFLSTHPDPGNREERIKAEIARLYPNGVPANLGEGEKAAFLAVRERVARSLPSGPSEAEGGRDRPESQEN